MNEYYSYLYNFSCGIAAGSSGAFISHPFLNIKNKLQSDGKINRDQYTSIKWLYTGLFRAVCNYSVEKMLVFGVYNSLRSHDINPTLAGAIAGITVGFTLTPGEQLIIDKQNKVVNYKIKHLFKALPITIMREMAGFAVHLSVYNYLMEKYNRERDISKSVGIISVSILGGWSFANPFDVIKTKIQSGTFDFKQYKLKDSLKGMKYALLRALPFHIASFLVMEYLMRKKKEFMDLFFF
jgi:hypothetical protein